MIQLAPHTLFGPVLETLSSERRADAEPQSSSLSAKASAASQPSEGVGVKKMLSELQGKFANAPDIAALIESEVQSRTADLYRRANYDALTHLPNRAYLQDILEKMVATSNQQSTNFSLLFLDLDGFKKVNDLQGHHIGDELLRHVSARLISSVREGDVVSRLGGDEFVVLLAETEDRQIVEYVCQRIIDEVSRPYWFDGEEVYTSTSIGVANFPEDAKVASDLIEYADKALYISKSKGKKTYRFYSDIEVSEVSELTDLQAQFDQAVSQGGLTPVVQPQVDLKQNRIVGGYVELQLDTLESMGAEDAWESLLKNSHWQAPVAHWLLDTACHYLNTWQKFDAEFVVTVPVMSVLWQQEDLVALLNQKMSQNSLSKNQLQLAFSLNDLANDSTLLNVLKEVSESGFQLTLTELGAAPLDLSVLSDLQVQEFKFDAGWLQKNMQTDAGKLWTQAVIQMVSSLDASMIAYGVKSEAEARQLKNWGCLLAQGEYWSETITVDKFASLLA